MFFIIIYNAERPSSWLKGAAVLSSKPLPYTIPTLSTLDRKHIPYLSFFKTSSKQDRQRYITFKWAAAIPNNKKSKREN